MASTLQVLFDGTPAGEDFYTTYASLEVEENADLPGAFQLLFPVSRSADGDLTGVADARFKPLANLAVVATPEGKADECIFDGHVLAHKLHLERGATNGMLTVWGQDASWLMNLKEKVREWVDMTDSAVAAAIFGDYGISPADDNAVDDSASHPESGHTLMQRASDIQFLRMLARRNGKLCRVACKDKPATSRRSRPRSVSNARRRRGCTTTRPGTAATRPSRPPGSRRSATASRDSRSLREHPDDLPQRPGPDLGRLRLAQPGNRQETTERRPMPGLLTTASVMMCPHSGTVTATTSNTRARAGGAFLLRASDVFTLAGCAFNIAGAPHPCVLVRWVQPALQGKAGGDFLLTEASVGLCVAPDQAVQGTVLILATQPKVAGR